jgi:hypothetical protein
MTITPRHTDGPADGPAHFLDGLRCIWCNTLNASWLCGDGTTVECAECGQTSLTTPDMTPDPEVTEEGA